MKVPTLDCTLADATLQTPMPESEPGSEFEPPPPDSSPFRQRKWILFQPCPPLFVKQCGCCIMQGAFLTLTWLRRWTADFNCETQQGGEREVAALQAEEAAFVDAHTSPT